MKKVVLFVFMLLQLWACGQVKYREVLSLADEFVSSLETDYQSYGLLGGVEKIKYTRDGLYQVFPMGRLINVKIDSMASDDDYEQLRQALAAHYSDDGRVKQVYRCNAGTIMIDCRN